MDTIAGATVFRTASSASRTRSVCEMAPPLGIAPSSHRLTGGPHTLCVERNALRGSGHRKPRSAHRIAAGAAIAPGRNCTCVVPLRRRMPVVSSATGANEMVARLGAAPSVSSSQARRIAVFLARDVEIGGLCGHCSRDLPLDRRLLFVAELTGQGWWVVSVTLRRWSDWTTALQAARDLYAATNPRWLRDVECVAR